jgi:hypothetical protein
MKRTLLFVSVWLVLTIVGGGEMLFAMGVFSGSGRGTAAQDSRVAEIAEVKEQDYPVRKNPNTTQASGNVYALPGTPLKPEPERLPPPVYAIAGVKGVEIEEGSPVAVDIIVNLPEKETFSRGILEGEDVSEWIDNLPEGLEARAHGMKKGAKTIKLYVTGTPAVTMREIIKVTIPGTYLTGGKEYNVNSPTEEESFDSWQKSQTE